MKYWNLISRKLSKSHFLQVRFLLKMHLFSIIRCITLIYTMQKSDAEITSLFCNIYR